MSRQTDRDPYRGRDPRQIPAFTLFDAARYLHLPEGTIRNWAYGYPYPTRVSGQRQAKPLIDVESSAARDFSFLNLIELHVLGALRREHRLKLPTIRRGIDFLKKELESPRPLIHEDMETDGVNIFVTKVGQLINVTQHGQLAMKALLAAHLRRIDRDARGVPIRLFPFTQARKKADGTPQIANDQPRIIAIDPGVQFGRPVIAGSRVPTVEIFERFNAGESPNELAEDFGRTLDEILEAIRCESTAAAA